jgi:hypothetical protein
LRVYKFLHVFHTRYFRGDARVTAFSGACFCHSWAKVSFRFEPFPKYELQLSCGFNCRSTCLFRGWKSQLFRRIWAKVKQRSGPSRTGIFPFILQILASWRLFSPLEFTLADAFTRHQTCLFRGWKWQLLMQLKCLEIAKIYKDLSL